MWRRPKARCMTLIVALFKVSALTGWASVGAGRCFSLESLTAEFSGKTDWIQAAQALREQKVIKPKASDGTALLWAFGHLISNTDMHQGNVSFISDNKSPL